MVNRKIVPIISALCVLSLIFMGVSLYISKKLSPEFIPPEFDKNAVFGSPDEKEISGFGDLTQEGMAYSISMCGEIRIEDQKAVVYFTNHGENTVWLKIRLIDENGIIIGESGIIKPGEYVKNVSLGATPRNGSTVTVKVMGYEPFTYHSAGAVSFNTNVYTD